MEQEKIIELHGVSVFQPIGADVTLSRRNYTNRGEAVLTDVSLEVAKGEIVYLIGRVGSGKSSLLRTIYADLPLCVGEGSVAGFDLATLRTRDIPYLRRKLGIVFQNYRLLTDRNVFENLHFVMKATGWHSEPDMRHRIDEVLGLVGLHHKEYKMPFELSGGEQQRLAIARAVINRPAVILADEPTGNLDPAASDEVMSLFKTIAESGCAIMMSTHNLSNISVLPSRTLRFSSGRVEQIDITGIIAGDN